MADLSTAPIPIVVLDYPSADAALALVDRLGDACGFYKVGLELFTAEGPSVVHAIRERGADVFLDLKLHDIPNTVAGAVRSAARLGARLLTVHTAGGAAMLAASADAAAGTGCGLLAVTLLTSIDAGTAAAVFGRDVPRLEDEVLRLAALADSAGLHGVVCSGHEASLVRERFGGRLATLVPGIRLAGGPVHDHARAVTPATVARAGARYAVIGRAVTAAADPTAALAQVVTELQGASAAM